MEKIILGIDPGTNIMGYGVLKVMDRKVEMMTMGVIDLRKFGDGYLKLGHIFADTCPTRWPLRPLFCRRTYRPR